MATSTVFLQADVDDGANTGQRSGYKGVGSTDMIRQMLREQKKQSKSLHSNALFKELAGAGGNKQGGHKRFGKGFNTPTMDSSAAPAFDDAEAEGNSRLVSLIKDTAEKDERPQAGVWASFGKPYQCTGELTEPSSHLPFLLQRDEIAREMDARAGRKGQRGPQALAELGPKPPGTAGSFRRALSTATSLDSNGDLKLTPEELEEQRLTKHRTTIVSTNHDKNEARFPPKPLKQARARTVKSKVTIGAFLDPEDADAEANDPELAYGQPPVPTRDKIPLHEKKGLGRRKSPRGRRGKKGAEVEFEDEDVKSKIFITQGEGGEVPEMRSFDNKPSMSGRKESTGFSIERPTTGASTKDKEAASSSSPFNNAQHSGAAGKGYEGDEEFLDEHEMYGGGRPPHTFMPLVQPAVPPRGQEDNPVYRWHNKFVEVRQRGRDQLQRALYERAEGRLKARSEGRMAANLSGLLMLDLEAVQGRKVPYPGNSEPSNPYGRMEKTWNAIEETKKAKKEKALTLNPDELKGLQRFYDQLCSLMESQEKMSDPICLMIVHKVRDGLESGTALNKGLLALVIEHVASFTKAAGLMRFNRFLLPILSFVARSSGVSELEFEDHVASHGIQIVIYGTVDVPSVIEEKSRPGSQGLSGPKSSRQLGSKSSKQLGRASSNGLDLSASKVTRDPEAHQPSGQSSGLPQIKIKHAVSNSGAVGKKDEIQLSARKEKPATLKDVTSLVEGVEMTAADKVSLAFASSLGFF